MAVPVRLRIEDATNPLPLQAGTVATVSIAAEFEGDLEMLAQRALAENLCRQ